jgi:hypothetical protein
MKPNEKVVEAVAAVAVASTSSEQNVRDYNVPQNKVPSFRG